MAPRAVDARGGRQVSVPDPAGAPGGGGRGTGSGLKAIEHNVAVVASRLGPLTSFPFGFDRRSVVWVEEFLERQRADPQVDAERLVEVLGSFLGQCLVHNGAGQWLEREEGWCVHSERSDVFPFTKVAKQARHGLAGGDSIVSFYDLALEMGTSPFEPGSDDNGDERAR